MLRAGVGEAAIELYDLRNFRSDEQLQAMRALDEAGICIFCPEFLTSDPAHPVLHETEHWIVTRNKFPYENTRLHLLLVPRHHVDDVLALAPAARDECWSLLEWVKKTYDLDFFAVGIRSGDFHRTGSSIYHVHVHVIVGDVDDPEHKPVRFKMSSRP